MIATIVAVDGDQTRLLPSFIMGNTLDLELPRKGDGFITPDTEIGFGVCDRAVTEEMGAGDDVARLTVDDGSTRAPQAVTGEAAGIAVAGEIRPVLDELAERRRGKRLSATRVRGVREQVRVVGKSMQRYVLRESSLC